MIDRLTFLPHFVPPERRRLLEQGLRQLVADGAKGRQVVMGQASGKKPRYFVVGDEPCPMDYAMNRPFCGGFAELANRVNDTLKRKDGTEFESYYTYLVKCTLPADGLTEEDLTAYWLPALQYEFALTGCRDIVCVGPLCRTVAGLIPIFPESLSVPRPTVFQRLRSLWTAASA